MAESIIIVGPQWCGKTLNAKALAQAYGLKHWRDAEGNRHLPKEDHLILANVVPRGAHGMQVIQFAAAIKKVTKPYPAAKNTFAKMPVAAERLPIRRPEVMTVAARLRRENPSWSEMKCLEQAKSMVIRKSNYCSVDPAKHPS